MKYLCLLVFIVLINSFSVGTGNSLKERKESEFYDQNLNIVEKV